jgi:hypothetical protein
MLPSSILPWTRTIGWQTLASHRKSETRRQAGFGTPSQTVSKWVSSRGVSHLIEFWHSSTVISEADTRRE